MQNYIKDEVLTPQMRHDLSLFCYQQGYLDGYDEPVIGHYLPDLIFNNEPNFHRVVPGVDEATQTALDYPQDQDEEGPLLAPIWVWLILLIGGGCVVVAILAFCTITLPWLTRCYLEMKGC
jgi:hypothetical protein